MATASVAQRPAPSANTAQDTDPILLASPAANNPPAGDNPGGGALPEYGLRSETITLGGSSAAAVVPVSADSAPPGPLMNGKTVYGKVCSGCHDTGASGSPRIDDAGAWVERLPRGKRALYASAIRGKGAMPARGGDKTLRDPEVRGAVDFMLASVNRAPPPILKTAPAPEPPPPVASAPAPVIDAPSAPAVPEWLSGLRGGLDECEKQGFLARVMCIERVRWRYCDPGRWNTVSECAISSSQ
jgi:cytochrome c5